MLHSPCIDGASHNVRGMSLQCLLARDRFTAMEELKDPRIWKLVQSELDAIAESKEPPDPFRDGPVPAVVKIAMQKETAQSITMGVPAS